MSHQAARALAAPGSLRPRDDGVRSCAQPSNDQTALPVEKIEADQTRGKTEERAERLGCLTYRVTLPYQCIGAK
jgi:hypothetical protein